jgi:hypothetical protein
MTKRMFERKRRANDTLVADNLIAPTLLRPVRSYVRGHQVVLMLISIACGVAPVVLFWLGRKGENWLERRRATRLNERALQS